ncbi:hypothetical protein TcBrA4_0076430 [Trypanosoma cruzi]|nr:hypothetical protein TcBrA4_0076430 [Trypanosoma cruzi]
MDFGTHHQALGGFGPYRTRCESPGAPNTKFRDPIAPARRAGAARELGAHRGLIIAERERLGAHHAYAIAGARNRNTEPHSQAEEAHNSLSAREAGIAVAGWPSCRAGTEVWRHVFCTWRPFFGTRLCSYHFFIKAVRRRLSALNRGIVLETSPANLPPSVAVLGEGLRHIIENIIVSEASSPQKRHRPPSSRMHRPMDGESFLFQTPATLKLPGEMGEEDFSYHAGRGARGTLCRVGLFRHLAIHHGRFGGQHFAAGSGE